LIRFDNVVKSFRRQNVLDGLTLSIGDGDRVALIGSNGAGKTTLIRCLLGEYNYDGEIRMNGLSPRQDRKAILKDIGFVPQLPPPLRMPVGELIHFAAAITEAKQDGIVALASRLGLDTAEVWSKPFVKLSGGQKQKLLVAVALGRTTRLLILDEPTANLDPASRKVMFEALAARQGTPMIISSHRLEEVSGLVNRVIELDRGRVVLDDRVADAGDLDARQSCRITLTRPEPAFAKAIAEWEFRTTDNGLVWQGEVAGPDRLRFLGVLSRYAGLLAGVQLESASGSGTRKLGSQRTGEVRHAG